MVLNPRALLPVATLALTVLSSLPAPATAATPPPVIGSANTATAEPSVPRPRTTPCTVTLYSNLTFADFSPKPFTYTPPAACSGPWAKVVLETDFSVTTGRQFDRTAQIAIGHVNVYYGTTSEPSSTLAPSWHVERDLTDYGALLRTVQSGEVNLGNLVDSTYTGIIHGSAVLKIYPASATEPAPRVADAVLSLSTAPGGAALLATGASTLAPTLSLPTNVEAAYLDVVSQSQSGDEFWYTCVPDDVSGVLFSCPGTAFREAQVTVDGQPAGVAPVYPWIYTGAIDPLLWRPIPAVQTLSFVPYRVDLTPFAGELSDGQPHQVGVSVFNANNYFLVAASLLLYRDHGAAQVTGAVTRNTLAAAPQPAVQKNLHTEDDGTANGTVTTRSDRLFAITGYVDTSHGRVETTVGQTVRFSNRQQFDITATRYVQQIDQGTEIASLTTTKGGGRTTLAERHFSWPLSLDYSFIVNDDGTSFQTVTVDQRYEDQDLATGPGLPRLGQISAAAASTDTQLFDAAGNFTGVQDRKSSQSYVSRRLDGLTPSCYSRSIAAVNGLVTAVTDGRGCPGH